MVVVSSPSNSAQAATARKKDQPFNAVAHSALNAGLVLRDIEAVAHSASTFFHPSHTIITERVPFAIRRLTGF